MRVVFQYLGWYLCVVYGSIPLFWLAIHPFAGYWRSRKRSPYRVLLPAWAVLWIVLALVTFPWRNVILYSTLLCWISAVILFACGFWLYFASTRNFGGKQVGGLAEILPGIREHGLVISGIRSRIRHPMYLGHFCEMLGWSIGTGLAVCYGLTLFAIITGILMVRMEDNELQLRFGEQYSAYRRAVPAFLPKFDRDSFVTSSR
jgi:protein-S-isoprenylcysteine O-methyltransferase Ste14